MPSALVETRAKQAEVAISSPFKSSTRSLQTVHLHLLPTLLPKVCENDFQIHSFDLEKLT